jgi:hypothetical protein
MAKYVEVIPPQMPPVAQRAANLAASAVEIAKSRFKRVPDHVRDQRLSVCESCEFWNPKAYMGFGGCTHLKCGCSIRTKVLFAASECPIKSWGKYTG